MGAVTEGPFRHLNPGSYRIRLKLSGPSSRSDAGQAIAVLEILSQRDLLAHRLVTPSDIAKGEIELDFDVSTDQSNKPGFSMQTIVRTLAPIDLEISSLGCERLSHLSIESGRIRSLEVKEWLPLLWTGSHAMRKNGQIYYSSRKPGIVFHGPYWRLPKGRYQAVFKMEAQAPWLVGNALARAYAKSILSTLASLRRWISRVPDSTFRRRYPLCTFQAMSGETELASKVMFVDGWQLQKEVAIPFEVTASDSARPDFGFEFRLLAHGRLPFTFSSVTVHRTES
ncbi:MAG: hypothetical protein JO211_12025 [Acidobacteriaceae bacterium]|nr:hypothetical protein [Acidobacteriaceae bacterium]